MYEQQAITRDKSGERKTLYPHFTCATDTNNIRRVFSDVKDTVLLKSLRDYGVIWTSRQCWKAGEKQTPESLSERRDEGGTWRSLDSSRCCLKWCRIFFLPSARDTFVLVTQQVPSYFTSKVMNLKWSRYVWDHQTSHQVATSSFLWILKKDKGVLYDLTDKKKNEAGAETLITAAVPLMEWWLLMSLCCGPTSLPHTHLKWFMNPPNPVYSASAQTHTVNTLSVSKIE